jgi:coniferyl-aldehyde dehydrogenase
VNHDHPQNVPKPSLRECLEAQRRSFLAEGEVPLKTRKDRLRRAIHLLRTHGKRLAGAMSEDFGHRSEYESLMLDIAGSIAPLQFALKHVRDWMRPEKRALHPFALRPMGAKARVIFQPLGVVGVLSPWNFPVHLTFSPLAGILAAGNRCMVKPSEHTPATSALLAEIFPTEFDPLEIAVFPGGPKTAADFCALPFDHLLFTGAASVAPLVLRAAAENLVPVTLELGGKSPAIVGRSARFPAAAESLLATKLLNAGQMCVAPDYAFVPREQLEEFTNLAIAAVGRLYPSLLDNPDYSSVIHQRHLDRLRGYLDEARARGVRLIEINPASEDFGRPGHRKMAPTILVDPPDDLAVMQDEIFGPIFPIKPYDNLDEVLDFLRDRPTPLALYYYGHDRAEQDRVIHGTTSGGITINDAMMHITQEGLPFGGVGQSGMGAYHGHDGFLRFSHSRAVYFQSPMNVAKLAGLRPPFTKQMQTRLESSIR